MDKRQYVQRARAESSEQTRRRILAAARDSLERGPLGAVKVEEVARDAGVSRSTVYLLFGSRRGLFEALAYWLRDEAGFGRLIEAYRQPDALQAFRDACREGVRLYATMPELARAVFTLAAIDPDAVGAVRALEDGRLPGMRSLARRLADQGYLRPDVTTREAADVLTVATSFQAFDQLFAVRGRSTDATATRLRAIVERTICRPDVERG
jgi:AcrR family transcriptional regulator